MSPVLVLAGVAASDALADLWRVVCRGPTSGRRLLGRLLGSALLRAGGLAIWLSITVSVAWWRSPAPIGWGELWAMLAVGLVPLMLSAVAVAPHIGPLLYLGLHTMTIVQLTTRLQGIAGLSVLDSWFAVLLGAAGFWAARGIGLRGPDPYATRPMALRLRGSEPV